MLIPYDEIYENPEFDISFSGETSFISSSLIHSNNPDTFAQEVLSCFGEYPHFSCLYVRYAVLSFNNNGELRSCITEREESVESMLMCIENELETECSSPTLFYSVYYEELCKMMRIRRADVRYYETKMKRYLNELCGVLRREEERTKEVWKKVRMFYYKLKGALTLGWMVYKHFTIHNKDIAIYLEEE